MDEIPTLPDSLPNPLPIFPKELITIELPRISLNKLLHNDVDEAEKMVNICTRTGFFYLDLLDHPKGRELWKNACIAHDIGRHVMSTLPMKEKDTFLKRPEIGILDRGYQSTIRDEHGETKYVESVNIPRDELFAASPTAWKLPQWLQEHEAMFKTIMEQGHEVSNIMLGMLEGPLGLGPGTSKNCHQLADPSHSFLRILRYPGAKNGKPLQGTRFFAHRDIVSVAILITWIGALQIPKENSNMITPDMETEESWRWVKPLHGHAIVNLGDAMPIFTNNVLKSGRHRVVTAPGEQVHLDRCSVLISERPGLSVPMKAFKSPRIPEDATKAETEVMTCGEWGDNCVKDSLQKTLKVHPEL